MNVENTPRCRPCGNMLKSEAGCAFCSELKPLLIWPAVSEDAEYSAATIINISLRALKARLRKLEKAMKAEGSGYEAALTRDLTSIGRTLKELAAEQRKLEDRDELDFAKLGIEGRMELYTLEFFAKLPEDFQVKLLESMRDTYSAQNAPLLPESTDE